MNILDTGKTASIFDRTTDSLKQSVFNTRTKSVLGENTGTERKDSLILSSNVIGNKAGTGVSIVRNTGDSNKSVLQSIQQAGAGNTANTVRSPLRQNTLMNTSLLKTGTNPNTGSLLNPAQSALKTGIFQTSPLRSSFLDRTTEDRDTVMGQPSLFQKTREPLNQNIMTSGNTPERATSGITGITRESAGALTSLETEKPSTTIAGPLTADSNARDILASRLNIESYRTTIDIQTGQNPVLDLLG